MNLRQKMLLKELPNNNYNISKTAKKVGYSESYATSAIYPNIRKNKNLREYFDEQMFWKTFKKIHKELLKSKDSTNKLRFTELWSKILGMQVDKSVNTNLNINEEKKVEIDNYFDNLLKQRNLNIPQDVVGGDN